MELHFAFKDIEATEAIKAHATKKVEKFNKYITYPMDVHFIFSVNRGEHIAEITCHAEHKEMVAVAKSADLYESIDAVVGKIETQMKKEREKHKGHQAAHKVAHGKGEHLGTDVAADLPHQGKRAK